MHEPPSAHDTTPPPSGRRRLRPVRLTALAAAAALAAAGVVTTTSATATSAAAAPGLAGAPVPALSWHACDSGFECATAKVPLDYARPGGRKISVALIEHKATDGNAKAPVLFVNSGGPTEQIEPFTESFGAIPAALASQFDIVTFDPRGFGFSTPVQCFASNAAEAKFLAALPPFPAGARQDAAWEKTYAQLDARCARRGGPLLDHDSTADVARDMDQLRAAIGAPMLNYYGLSYGTGLGAVYANMFPSRVGHVVLDGNLDPVSWTAGGPLPNNLRDNDEDALASTMKSFLTLCGQAPASGCAFSAGTPAATTAKWQTLQARLLAHPVQVGGQPFTDADMLTSVPLGTVGQWQQGGQLLQALWTLSGGGSITADQQSLLTAALAAEQPDSGGPVYTGVEQQLAVQCTDTSDPRTPAAYQAAASLASTRAGGFGTFLAWNEEPCADWPGKPGADVYTGPWNRPTANPILVIGITGDPSTPYANSVAMAHDLSRARLLTVSGFGHTELLNPSTCANNAAAAYLAAGTLPAAGTVCPQGAPF